MVNLEGIGNKEVEMMRCLCKDGCGETCYSPLFDIPVMDTNGKIIGYKKLREGRAYAIRDRHPFIDARGLLKMIEL